MHPREFVQVSLMSRYEIGKKVPISELDPGSLVIMKFEEQLDEVMDTAYGILLTQRKNKKEVVCMDVPFEDFPCDQFRIPNNQLVVQLIFQEE